MPASPEGQPYHGSVKVTKYEVLHVYGVCSYKVQKECQAIDMFRRGLLLLYEKESWCTLGFLPRASVCVYTYTERVWCSLNHFVSDGNSEV